MSAISFVLQLIPVSTTYLRAMGQLNAVSDLLFRVFVTHFILASLLDPKLEGEGKGGGENVSSGDD